MSPSNVIVKVVAESLAGRSLPLEEAIPANIQITGLQDRPAEPQSVTSGFDGANIVWTITPPIVSGNYVIAHYKVLDGNGAFKRNVHGLVWADRPEAGETTVIRDVYTVSTDGRESLVPKRGTFGISSLGSPTTFTMTFDGDNIISSWSAVSGANRYQVSRSAVSQFPALDT